MKHLFFALIGLFLFATPAYASHLSGRILIDVEQNGEAWYVSPLNGSRYFLGRPDQAFELMRSQGLGISNTDLARFDQDVAMRRRLAGRILLQVESRGEAYYVDPQMLTKHYLGRPADAFRVMTEKGLGISSADLAGIPIANSSSSDSVTKNTVPFVAQAPFGAWSDLRLQEACEEASVYMAMQWVRGKTTIDPQAAKQAFLQMSEWEEDTYGTFIDTSAKDTMDRLLKEYFQYEQVSYKEGITTQDIHQALKEDAIVLVTINGVVFDNPYYSSPRPQRHMVVIFGYDASSGEFVLNDPGTRHGGAMRVFEENLRVSLRDYDTGTYRPIPQGRTAMIIVRKETP